MDGSGTAVDTAGDTTSAQGSTSSGTTSTGTGTSSGSGVDGSASGDSTTADVPCVEGTFAGRWHQALNEFTGTFVACEGSVTASAEVEFPVPLGPTCFEEVWIEVAGTLCGPGRFLGGFEGWVEFDYAISGTVVDGPCLEDRCVEPTAPCTDPSWACGCDVVAQDCTEDDKCAPADPAGGPPWSTTHCFPLPPDPAGDGEPCVRTDGIDDCDVGLVCRVLDPDSGTGVCAPLCDPQVPATCADTCEPCTVTRGAPWVGVCIASCPAPCASGC